jgi:hypothetical protein
MVRGGEFEFEGERGEVGRGEAEQAAEVTKRIRELPDFGGAFAIVDLRNVFLKGS